MRQHMACENGTIQNDTVLQPEFTTPGGASSAPIDPETGQPLGPEENGGPMAGPSGETPAPGMDDDRGSEVERRFPGGLGSLSARYESNGNPAAIGYDRTGGWSYGRYQIASNVGSMRGYLNYLRQTNPSLYQQLQAAGGDAAARRGDARFRSEWQRLMANPSFAQTQHDYQRQSNYSPGIRNIRAATGIDFSTRSAALNDVVWSTSVQHGGNQGGADRVFRNAQQRFGLTAASSDADWIRAVYAERRRVGTYFRSSTPQVQQSVYNRFVREEADALAALGQ